MPSLEFAGDCEITLPKLPLPVRIGEILDYIDSASDKNLQISDFKLDTTKNIISRNGKNLNLTEKESAILKYLAQNNGPATRDAMLKTIWGYSEAVDSKTLENHIYRLRQKISATFAHEIIITADNGYKTN